MRRHSFWKTNKNQCRPLVTELVIQMQSISKTMMFLGGSCQEEKINVIAFPFCISRTWLNTWDLCSHVQTHASYLLYWKHVIHALQNTVMLTALTYHECFLAVKAKQKYLLCMSVQSRSLWIQRMYCHNWNDVFPPQCRLIHWRRTRHTKHRECSAILTCGTLSLMTTI